MSVCMTIMLIENSSIEIGQVACQFLDGFRNRQFEHIKCIKTTENTVNAKEKYIYNKNINLFLLECTLI